MNREAAPEIDFSLVGHGPFERLLRRVGISDAALGRVGARILVLIAVAWLPLLALAAADGRALGGVQIPLLLDADLYTRYFVGLPMLLAAEVLLHRRLPSSFNRFLDRGLVPAAERDRFEAAVAGARRWLDSGWAELAMLVFVYAIGVRAVWGNMASLELDTWYAPAQATPSGLRPAGWWMAVVAVPLMQFLLLRWYYRLAVWLALLVRIASLPLQLHPLHPDKSGGLGFLAQLSLAFSPLMAAHGAMAAGWIANQLAYGGARLTDFRVDLFFMCVVVLALVLAPLLAFAPALSDARRLGLAAYGQFANRYAVEFESRWLHPARPESALGSGDIQSLADLGNSYQLMQQMRMLPFGTGTIMQLAVALLLPIAPLALTMFSVDELIARLLKLIF